MAAKKRQNERRAAGAELPRMFEAERAGGASGAVLRGSEIDLATAIRLRLAGQDVVVCGGHLRSNRNLARNIEVG